MELETASRLNLPVVVLVANNGAASGAIYEFPEYDADFSRYVPDIRYDQIARAFGGSGACVQNGNQLASSIENAIDTAKQRSKPYLLNIAVSDQVSMPPRL